MVLFSFEYEYDQDPGPEERDREEFFRDWFEAMEDEYGEYSPDDFYW